MRAARIELLVALALMPTLSGCYGWCLNASPYGGLGAYGVGCADYGYGAYGTGAYDDCVGGVGAPYYGGYGYPPFYDGGFGAGPVVRDRLTLRERLRLRREARALRREGRHLGRPGRRGGRGGYGEFAYGTCCGDCGCFDPCCGESWFDCGSCCDSCMSCCTDCGPCMDTSSCCGNFGCCDTYGGEIIDGGIIDGGMIDGEIIDGGIIDSSGGQIMGGSPVGPEWESTFVPYSHEGRTLSPGSMPVPSEGAPYLPNEGYREMTPQPRNGRHSGPQPSPAPQPSVEEGPFERSEGEPQSFRSPRSAAQIQQTYLVPPQF